MSQLKVNSIIPVSGVPTGGGGGITQIKINNPGTNFFTAATLSLADSGDGSATATAALDAVKAKTGYFSDTGYRFRLNTYELTEDWFWPFKKEVKKFVNGQYSKFEGSIKNRITRFFGNIGTISEYVESYLYPENFYEDYSKILKIPIEDLKDVGELCDKPNLEK